MGLFGKKKSAEKSVEEMQREINSYLKNSSYGRDVWCFFFGWEAEEGSGARLHGNEDFYRMSMSPLNYVPAEVRRNTDPRTKTYTWRFGDWAQQDFSDSAVLCLSELGFSRRTNSRYQGSQADTERRKLCECMEKKVKQELGESVDPDPKVYVTRKQGAYDEVFVVSFKIRCLRG